MVNTEGRPFGLVKSVFSASNSSGLTDETCHVVNATYFGLKTAVMSGKLKWSGVLYA